MKTLLLLACLAAPCAFADEGMWTYDNVPKDRIKAKYNFEPSDAWLKKAMRSSARLAMGCSGSFVSPSGLVMTNHHCVHACVQQLSTKEKDYVELGFYAKAQADEVKCPAMEVNQLVDISDVTAQVVAATDKLEGEKRHEAEVAITATLEKKCQTSDALLCDVVSLYHGGEYKLYKYRRFQDVRLAFAPEYSIAAFGGDPDNFMYPRYDLDASFIRVYEGGKPAKMDDYFKWSPKGGKDGDLVFVSGHPGGTDRKLTVAQLEQQRDVVMPDALMSMSEYRGKLTEYLNRGPEQKRHATGSLFMVENSIKAMKGEFKALLDKNLITAKRAEEDAFRAKVAANAEMPKKCGTAWDDIAGALEKAKAMRKARQYYSGFQSSLFKIAKALVVGTEEIGKPNEKRYPEYSDSSMPAVKARLMSGAPIYPELEIFNLTSSFTKMREELGPDDPFVKKVLGQESPEELAARLVKGSKLADVPLRKKLWDGGSASVRASDDPMIQLALLIDADSRAVRRAWETDIEPVITKASEAIARAHFELEGKKNYPDATFTLRLSYGQVKGWMENGRMVNPVTTFAGAFDRATGRDPFALPPTWLSTKAKLDLTTPFNFVTTNDIVGGNSGSPVFNKDLQIVGLAFDGNIHSLGGQYGFDESMNRAVAVENVAITEALRRIYGGERLLKELGVASSM